MPGEPFEVSSRKFPNPGGPLLKLLGFLCFSGYAGIWVAKCPVGHCSATQTSGTAPLARLLETRFSSPPTAEETSPEQKPWLGVIGSQPFV